MKSPQVIYFGLEIWGRSGFGVQSGSVRLLPGILSYNF